METFESWGRYPRLRQRVRTLSWRTDVPAPHEPGGTVLAVGQGRSYGDSCLDEGGTLLSTRRLDRFISFDPGTGVLACESGVTLAEILERFAQRGWFPPVVPGTKHVTVGGAIANDIHGKNHHRAGSFGRHVLRLELIRSTGERLRCGPREHPELFAATVGGLGLTGLISWAEIQLRPISSELIDSQTVPFQDLDGFFAISGASDTDWEYTVAWFDCLARGAHLGRGVFFRGNHARSGRSAPRAARPIPVPCDAPGFLLNRFTVAAFNTLYRARNARQRGRIVPFDPFFFPLDGVARWNRLYGARGFQQFQCVVPMERGADGIRAVLAAIAASRQASFLAVLKTFGSLPSPGLLSFPRPGVTLALDFPHRGERTLELFRRLEALVLEHGGAMYPAKDACMSRAMFEASFPRWRELERVIDPAFSSSFWRRVTGPGRAT